MVPLERGAFKYFMQPLRLSFTSFFRFLSPQLKCSLRIKPEAICVVSFLEFDVALIPYRVQKGN